MDIEYLLLLQRLREAAGGLLTPLMELVSELAASSVTIGAAAFVFWAVDRHFGGFLMLNYVGSSLLNQAVKLTACVYRPWVRDGRVQPVLTALDKATGYSFPSGHTQSAAAIYGSVALWYGKKRPWLASLMAAMILLTGFSRNYLGVHTPQDVIVSMALCAGYLWLNGKVAALLEKRPGLDAAVAAAGVAFALASVAWFSCKSYPLDYVDGALLVDPVVMMEDGFMAAGMVFGFYPGWLIERRWLRFTTSPRRRWQYALAAAALVPMLAIYRLLPGALAGLTGPLWAEFISCALLAFYVMALVPALICRIQRRRA
ncbi:MAG TPA: phosphatase PAP2 family protein [Candidatus Faecalibacterium faecipullorum]|uniref:Phosphatase PAP2 family protein n=1 Tax=Candidatus Faecalibacterium faecipullorum TaxID=2838578 RepID=A0A9D2MFR1_9FIRM|nr:phosphatase PAP2 family protein [Candidatus Faecalibacterium faecipullorum]